MPNDSLYRTSKTYIIKRKYRIYECVVEMIKEGSVPEFDIRAGEGARLHTMDAATRSIVDRSLIAHKPPHTGATLTELHDY